MPRFCPRNAQVSPPKMLGRVDRGEFGACHCVRTHIVTPNVALKPTLVFEKNLSRQFLRACFPTARSTDRTLGRTVLFGRCDIPQSTMLENAQVVDLCFTTLKVVLHNIVPYHTSKRNSTQLNSTRKNTPPPEPPTPTPISPQPLGRF